jgi:optic atrophy 3 protein
VKTAGRVTRRSIGLTLGNERSAQLEEKMSIPLVKLGYLVVRTLSKPIAKMVQRQAIEHPRFRAICTSFSQSYHRLEVRLRSRISDKQSPDLSPLNIKPLSEDKAIQLGGTCF